MAQRKRGQRANDKEKVILKKKNKRLATIKDQLKILEMTDIREA